MCIQYISIFLIKCNKVSDTIFHITIVNFTYIKNGKEPRKKLQNRRLKSCSILVSRTRILYVRSKHADDGEKSKEHVDKMSIVLISIHINY